MRLQCINLLTVHRNKTTELFYKVEIACLPNPKFELRVSHLSDCVSISASVLCIGQESHSASLNVSDGRTVSASHACQAAHGRKRGYFVQKHLSSQDWARICNSASCTSSPALVIFHAQSSCAHLSFRTKPAITFWKPHTAFSGMNASTRSWAFRWKRCFKITFRPECAYFFLVFSPLNAPFCRPFRSSPQLPSKISWGCQECYHILRPFCHSISATDSPNST
jgi:hypothetical protein